MSSFKDWVTIKVENATYGHFQGGLSLMGKYPHGKLVGRDGHTVFKDHNAFGQEWQVREDEPKLFQTVTGPQYPSERCVFPDSNTKKKAANVRAGQSVARDAARKACVDSTFYKGHIDLCVSDVMLSGDISVAHAN